MLKTYRWPRYDSPRAPELDLPAGAPPRRVPLVIVGAGPVGLAAAIDAALHGLPVLVLDEDHTVSIGSRAVCHAKRTLEVFDRLGIGQKVVEGGITWNVGRTFHGEREVFSFDLLPEAGHRRPGMVNWQQYHLEQALVERAMQLPAIDLRFGHRVLAVHPRADHVRVEVETADGRFTIEAGWLLACDGAKSPIRKQLGLDVAGKVFQDRFLIADVVLDGEPFPRDRTERRFWFEPPFYGGTSALMHREADDVWRIDFQLGWDADAEAEKQPGRVTPRIRAALDQQGFPHIGFELEWVSVYTFQCRRMASFRHGRVLFAGDSAHQVSPFGARGGNSGVQDADNLVWKLALVIRGQAPEALLDTYTQERGAAADENIAVSSRSTDFMTPKSRAARVFRDAVLSLAKDVPAGRALVNSGRLSVPTWYADSPLNTPDRPDEPFQGWMRPGMPLDDAPLGVAPGGVPWLLAQVQQGDFALLFFGEPEAEVDRSLAALAAEALPVRALVILPPAGAPGRTAHGLPAVVDTEGLAARRFDARSGTCVLVRPDQHVAARWRRFDAAHVADALARATMCAAPVRPAARPAEVAA
jgi:3-(3-hydroxy-phenyl)propionate hydroxylase